MRGPLPETMIILCGGAGTRLRPVLNDRPKVLAEIGGRPYLESLLVWLTRQGLMRIILSVGYLGEQVEAWVRTQNNIGPALTCVTEKEPLGTAGAIALAADSMALSGPFFVMNGDTFFDGSLQVLANRHLSSGFDATVALVQVEDTSRYGRVQFAGDSGVIERFAEKQSAGPGWINAGLYILDPTLITQIPRGTKVSLEKEVFPFLVKQGRLGCCPYPEGKIFDFGTPDAFTMAGEALTSIWSSTR